MRSTTARQHAEMTYLEAFATGLPEARREALLATWDPSRSFSDNLHAFRSLCGKDDTVPGRLLPTPPDAYSRLRDEVARQNNPRQTHGYDPFGKAPDPYTLAIERKKGAQS